MGIESPPLKRGSKGDLTRKPSPLKLPDGVKEAEVGVKWWHWVLLGLGLVMLIGGLVYGFLSGAFGG